MTTKNIAPADAMHCDGCGIVAPLHEVDLYRGGTERLCADCCPVDPECSCGGTGGDHDIDCVRFPF